MQKFPNPSQNGPKNFQVVPTLAHVSSDELGAFSKGLNFLGGGLSLYSVTRKMYKGKYNDAIFDGIVGGLRILAGAGKGIASLSPQCVGGAAAVLSIGKIAIDLSDVYFRKELKKSSKKGTYLSNLKEITQISDSVRNNLESKKLSLVDSARKGWENSHESDLLPEEKNTSSLPNSEEGVDTLSPEYGIEDRIKGSDTTRKQEYITSSLVDNALLAQQVLWEHPKGRSVMHLLTKSHIDETLNNPEETG